MLNVILGVVMFGEAAFFVCDMFLRHKDYGWRYERVMSAYCIMLVVMGVVNTIVGLR